MAKVKSKKIEDALMPVEEQLYDLPKNWNWVKIGRISHVYTGNSINERVKKEKYEGKTEGPLFIATKDVDFDNTINYETNVRITDSDNFKKAPACTSLLCIEGGSAGRKIGYTNQEVCFGNKLCAFSTSNMESKYIFYYLQSNAFAYQFNEKKHGLIGGVSVRDLKEIAIPLPPLSEQHRIVGQIERLFSKLDEAREKAQEVIDGFDGRRAAIIAQAFSGSLTEKWRKDNKYGLGEWKETILAEVVSGFKYGSSEKSTYENVGMPVLRIPNIGDGVIDFSDMKFLSHNDVDRDNQVHEDDLLIIRSNGSRDLVGKCAIVPELERDYAYASFLIRIKPSEVILPRFLLLYMNSSVARNQMFIKAKSSSGIHNINSKELGAIKIKVPSLVEQSEIVKILDEIFAKENEAKILAETVVDKIDEIKKSVLAKAFRGELGTHDSSDESAEELLKIILSEASVEEKKKSTTRRAKVKVVMNKDMLETVKEAGRITPERLKEETGLSIDEFYEELKRLTESGQVSEKREGGDVYLEVRDAN